MKRILFNNIIIKNNNRYILMNMTSFRRELISENDFQTLTRMDLKRSSNLPFEKDEQDFYNKLMASKQFLTNDIIEEANQLLKEQYNTKVRPFIKSATINLSYECNFKCTYCYQKNFNLKNTKMTVDDIDRIFTMLKIHQVQVGQRDVVDQLCISGGEPLLRQNLDVLKRILFLFKDCNLKLFTNATNINSYWNEINFKNFNEIQISLDGNDEVLKKVNNYYGNENLNSLLISIKKILDLGIDTSIVAMITQETIDNHESFMSSLRYYGLEKYENLKIRFSPVLDYKSEYSLDEKFYDSEKLLKLVFDLRNKNMMLPNCSIDSIYGLGHLRNLLYRNDNEIAQKFSGCYSKKGIPILFSPDGKIYWCSCVGVDKGVIGEFKPKLGFYDDKINDLITRDIYHIAECKTCDYKYVCGGGCPFPVILNKDNMTYPACSVFKDDYVMNNLEEFL